MPRNSPIEQNVFHFWAAADVVDDHVAAGLRGFCVDEDADVRNVAAEIPGDEIAGSVILHAISDGQGFPFACEKYH